MICADDPQTLADRIAALTSLTTYHLLPHPLPPLLDLYLDTADRALAVRGLALRIREIGTERWITLKGPARFVAGGKERMEIEAKWSEETWRSALAGAGLKLPALNVDFTSERSQDIVAASGLEVVQARENDRRVRGVVPVGDTREVAELAVDSVTYRFGDRRVRLHEVEIESKADEGIAALAPLAEALLARFSPALRRWDHGKLLTGKAIEAMLARGRLEGLIDRAGDLKPEAFDQIDRFIHREFALPDQ